MSSAKEAEIKKWIDAMIAWRKKDMARVSGEPDPTPTFAALVKQGQDLMSTTEIPTHKEVSNWYDDSSRELGDCYTDSDVEEVLDSGVRLWNRALSRVRTAEAELALAKERITVLENESGKAADWDAATERLDDAEVPVGSFVSRVQKLKEYRDGLPEGR